MEDVDVVVVTAITFFDEIVEKLYLDNFILISGKRCWYQRTMI